MTLDHTLLVNHSNLLRLTLALFCCFTSSALSDEPFFPAKQKWGTLVLVRGDVRAESVYVFGPDRGTNLRFAFANRSTEEIEALLRENLGKKIAIKDGDTVVGVASGGGGLETGGKMVGFVLLFATKAEALVAARILRGEKKE